MHHVLSQDNASASALALDRTQEKGAVNRESTKGIDPKDNPYRLELTQP